MMIFLILAPFGAFAMLMLVTSATVSLFAAAASAWPTIAYDLIARPLDQDPRRSAQRSCSPRSAAISPWSIPRWSSSAVRLAGRWRRAGDRAGVDRAALSLHAAICPRSRSMPRPRRCPASCAPTTSSPGPGPRAFLLMVIANVADDLCAGPAAVVRACDRVRRPQQRGAISPNGIRNTGGRMAKLRGTGRMPAVAL